MMKDLTALLIRYRELARNLHNNCFFGCSEFTFDSYDRLEVVKKQLFALTVLDECDIPLDESTLFLRPLSQLHVSVMENVAVPVCINRPSNDGNMYWDDPTNVLENEKVRLSFIGFFDWDVLSPIDFKYCRVRIEDFPDSPELIGRDALIEMEYCKITIDN